MIPKKQKVQVQKKYQRKQKPLTQEQVEVFRQAFEIFDSNHSGNINEQELQQLMNALGYNLTSREIKDILMKVDQDRSGLIQIDQFVAFMSKQMFHTQNIKNQFNKVFHHFDQDQSGFLDFKKIKKMVKQCYFNIDDDAIHKMIQSADTDGDDKISRDEFFRIMKKVKLI